MKQPKVFLIDDDSDDLEFMREAMKRVDPAIQCVSFIYPEEAIEVLTKELTVLPDFIFIDMNMPKIRGEDCLRVLRAEERFSSIPIILYSTSMPPEMSQKLLDTGANFAFVKPNTEKAYTMILQSIIFGNALSGGEQDRQTGK